jgi:hypothetical protein
MTMLVVISSANFIFKDDILNLVFKTVNSREATHRFRTSNNGKSNPEIKGRNSIFFRHDALQVSVGPLIWTNKILSYLINVYIGNACLNERR